MSRYCILGGGGSFGLHTAKYLLEQDGIERVMSVGRAAAKPECFTLGVGHGDPRYAYYAYHIGHELDLLLETLDKEQPDTIINFAAQGEGAASLQHSWRYFDTNCTALARLAEQISKRGWLKRFIHIGSSEIYGPCQHPVAETAALNPTSPYAISKAAFDLHLISIHKHLKFPMNIIRPSNAYGPGQQLYRLIPKATLCGLTGEKFPLHGGGVAEKSYIHALDLAAAIYLVAQKAPLGEIYNAGPDTYIAIRKVAMLVAWALGIQPADLYHVTVDRAHQDLRYWLNSQKIKDHLQWEPRIGWEQGLQDMVRWGKRYIDDLKVLPTEFQMRA